MSPEGYDLLRWTFRLEPVSGELLSAYLARVALLHGISPSRFCAFHFPGVPVWQRDIDRFASDSFIEAIGLRAGLTTTQLESMTLRRYERLFNSQNTPRQGVAAGVNAVGVFHRIRRRHGLQFCPSCLGEKKTFLIAWRLSCAVLCERHQTLLRDACALCGAVVIPHRSMLSITRCHACGSDLATQNTESISASITLNINKIQKKFFSALCEDHVMVGAVLVRSDQFILGMREVFRAWKSVGPRKSEKFSPGFSRTPFEMTRTNNRIGHLLFQHAVLNDWPDGFLEIARNAGVTKLNFRERDTLPFWLKELYMRLPDGKAKPRKFRSNSLRKQLVSLSRRKPAAWRTLRAQLLMRAAGHPSGI